MRAEVRNESRPAYRRVFVMLAHAGTILGLVCLVLLAIGPVILFPRGARPLTPTGPAPVTFRLLTLSDAGRADPLDASSTREVTVGLWYPEAGDADDVACPLLVFSHGGLGVLTSNESLYLELASHGYVVAALGHHGHALYVRTASGRLVTANRAYVSSLLGEDPTVDPAASLAAYREWLDVRLADIAFVVAMLRSDGAPDLAAPACLSRQRTDTAYGVMGHSLGGSAALAAGRRLGGVAAVMALESPHLGDLVAVDRGAFVLDPEPYTTPALTVYSDATWDRLADLPQYAGNLRLHATGSPSSRSVYVTGTGHYGLTDLALTSPLLTRWLDGGAAPRTAEEVLSEVAGVAAEFFEEHLPTTRP